MTDSKGKVGNAKDKIVGEVKEVIGKVTNNEELELKGKIQSSTSDVKKKAEKLKEFLDKIKEYAKILNMKSYIDTIIEDVHNENW